MTDRSTMRAEAVEAMARIMADGAYEWGDRLHDWNNSGEDVRDSFRSTANAALDALLSSGLAVLMGEVADLRADRDFGISFVTHLLRSGYVAGCPTCSNASEWCGESSPNTGPKDL